MTQQLKKGNGIEGFGCTLLMGKPQPLQREVVEMEPIIGTAAATVAPAAELIAFTNLPARVLFPAAGGPVMPRMKRRASGEESAWKRRAMRAP